MDYSRIFIALGVLLSLAHGSLSYPNATEIKECHDLKIVYNLYTKKNTEVPQKLEISSDMENSILQSNFNPNEVNKVLIHGFQDSAADEWIQLIKNLYLKNGSYNVWIVDWSVVADGPPLYYEEVVKHMNATGQCISFFGKAILNVTKAGENAFHIIGHSLGAHMAGYLASRAEKPIARITGLDPAFPLFGNGQKKTRVLSKDDATFVDILHTNGQHLGQTEAIGDVDFYLNGGSNQPQCVQLGNVCSHMSALIYFAESLNTTTGFYGYRCPGIDDYIAGRCPSEIPNTLMGEYVDKNANGTYIVYTNGVAPYARGPKL